MWSQLIRTTDASAPLVARLTLAVFMFPHGAQKAFGWLGRPGFQVTIGSMGQEGPPAAVPVLVMIGRGPGSARLLLGLLGRVVAAGIMGVMLSAIALVHATLDFS